MRSVAKKNPKLKNDPFSAMIGTPSELPQEDTAPNRAVGIARIVEVEPQATPSPHVVPSSEVASSTNQRSSHNTTVATAPQKTATPIDASDIERNPELKTRVGRTTKARNEPSASRSYRRITLNIDEDVYIKTRSCVYALSGPGESMTLKRFVEEALAAQYTKLARKHNQGLDFDAFDGKLTPGRPFKP